MVLSFSTSFAMTPCFFYDELCAEVNRYYEVTWNKWLEKLKSEYFANPWTVISLIAASILLGLTIVQTFGINIYF
ncbi:hypothetical protein RchiOBHm_Chr4g0411021 [Rosa chinensis]|uniref:Uncharacterized protein n=1 Tax=Rosa chinensis TaxID=74649 RepID=A0A2P6QVL6_ROSCH|nr:hypothetical protein RchiOBHm_Chr4g0411021 [Rosa chinensis]